MQTRRLDNFMFRLFFVSLALMILSGCEEDPAHKPVVGSRVVENVPSNEPKQETQQSVSVESLKTGQYLLKISSGKIGLNSAWSSRITILEDMARQIGFEFSYTDESDKFVLLDRSMGGMAELLEALLEDVNYSIEYNAQAGDDGFRIARLTVGSPPVNGKVSSDNNGTQLPIELIGLVPESIDEIYLGPDPDDQELASRLQFGSIEDQIDAVSELNLDPGGLSAAYQVYTHASSPEVRIAVLELIESEDNYTARLMTVMSLQSVDAAEAMVALSIVDSQDDFSLAPQVEALYNHHDAEVSEYAKEVLESITSAYDSPDRSSVIPLAIGQPDPGRNRGDIGADR
jgi:hypothetical protein